MWDAHPWLVVLCSAAGLLLSDPLAVVVERGGAHQSFGPPWWRCGSCEGPIGATPVPLLRSWSLRRGCRSCGAAVAYPFRPLVLGLASAAVLGAFAARLGTDPVLGAEAVFALALVALSAVDFEHFTLPNRILYPSAASVAVLLVVASWADHRFGSLARAAIAGTCGFAGMYLVHFVYPKGMGFGDVRLSGLVGLGVGWFGLGHAFVAFFAAFLLASVAGLAVAAVSGGGRKTKIPFGPYLALGAVVGVLFGSPLAHVLFHRGVG